MDLISVKTKINGAAYSAYRRYKVNDVVLYDSKTYQNTTGINTEPSPGGANWLLIAQDFNVGINTIVVNGNTFTLVKHPANFSSVLEVNDIIASGFWDGAEFWGSAIYLGADKDIKTNWLRLAYSDDIPLT